MGKITYWLRKLGILRTSSYVAKNVDELNEAVGTDGGMVQSQKEIDEKYKPEKSSSSKEQSSAKEQSSSDDNNSAW